MCGEIDINAVDSLVFIEDDINLTCICRGQIGESAARSHRKYMLMTDMLDGEVFGLLAITIVFHEE